MTTRPTIYLGVTTMANLGGRGLDCEHRLTGWARYFCAHLGLVVLTMSWVAGLILFPHEGPLALAGEQAGVCTDYDRETAEYLGSGGADAGYEFGLRIRNPSKGGTLTLYSGWLQAN